tara:strand:+ start:1174 stop:2049 length:876 start_codon:yes stop_codon:yes gene_type:complete
LIAMKNTPVTEAHRKLSRDVIFSATDGAQLIADSEAKATAELRGALALGQQNCDDVYDDLRAERDQLRANRNNLRADLDAVKSILTEEKDRAERAEAKISNQAERIRYLEGATNHATGTPLSQAIARAERAEAELTIAKRDTNNLNNLLRAVGWGQGEIDSAACVEEENGKLRAEVERLKRDYEYDHKCLYEVRERCELWKQRADRGEAELADLKANNRFQRGHSAGYAEAKADCEAELATEREKVRVLHSALQNLADEQNGAPLETRLIHWQMAMDDAGLALATAADALR